jgi:YD repeat-containing protein
MPISFNQIEKGVQYSRHQLAELWGYRTFHPIARGLVTPRGDNKLIFFITEGEGQQQTVQRYSNHFDGHTLKIEGPSDHFAEQRTLDSDTSGDELHLFHRENSRAKFTYYGQMRLIEHRLNADRPSRFTFEIS